MSVSMYIHLYDSDKLEISHSDNALSVRTSHESYTIFFNSSEILHEFQNALAEIRARAAREEEDEDDS